MRINGLLSAGSRQVDYTLASGLIIRPRHPLIDLPLRIEKAAEAVLAFGTLGIELASKRSQPLPSEAPIQSG